MRRNDEGVTTVMEYITITSVLMVMMIILMLAVNAVFMEGPADRLKYHAFVDIGNGISTRIVDLYVIAPVNGTITTAFDIPDDVAGKDYYVNVEMSGLDQRIVVTDGKVRNTVTISGIGATMAVAGNTTGAGWNRIRYDSRGFE